MGGRNFLNQSLYTNFWYPGIESILRDFHSYMKDNTTSERHQNNNLKAIIAFAEFVGLETTFYQISSKEQITKFLETQIKSNSEAPEGRWIASI